MGLLVSSATANTEIYTHAEQDIVISLYFLHPIGEIQEPFCSVTHEDEPEYPLTMEELYQLELLCEGKEYKCSSMGDGPHTIDFNGSITFTIYFFLSPHNQKHIKVFFVFPARLNPPTNSSIKKKTFYGKAKTSFSLSVKNKGAHSNLLPDGQTKKKVQ